MAKITVFRSGNPIEVCKPYHLTRDSMDWSTRVDEIQKEKSEELKALVNKHYEYLRKHIRLKIDHPSRMRFMVRVLKSFESYLDPTEHSVDEDDFIYFILYYIDYDSDDIDVDIDEVGTIRINIADKRSSRAILFILKQMMRFANNHTIDEFLKEML